jgi:hypothetical protein
MTLLSNRGVWPAWLWMFLLALLLGWLPFLGPAIAGFVGGLQAGDTRSALIASIIPSAIVAGVLLVLGSVIGVPFLAAIAGAGLLVILVVASLPLIAGAFIGGMVSERRTVG